MQTEDSGPTYPRLYTHLFFAGTILASKKQEYPADAAEDSVKLLMQQLHKLMIKELTQGTHDERLSAFFVARGEAPFEVQAAPPPAASVPAPPPAKAPSSPAPTPPPPPAPRANRQISISGSINTPGPVPRSPPPPPPARSIRSPTAAGEVRRPPVVLSSSTDGVVVQRNVVISVGGGSPPVKARPTRSTRPRPVLPYVVRDGSPGPLPAARVPGAPTPSRGLATTQQPHGPAREKRKVRSTQQGRVSDDSGRAAPAPAAPVDASAPERPQGEGAFGAPLAGDKSLDEVILEYLSDDTEPTKL